MADVGQSFSPFGQGQAQNRSAVEPVQEVIKLLSLRMPRNVGGSSPSPLPSQRVPGQLGQQLGTGLGQQLGQDFGLGLGNSIAERWLQALFAGQGMPDIGGGPGGGSRLPASVAVNDKPIGGPGTPIDEIPTGPAPEQSAAPQAPWQQGQASNRFDDPFRMPGMGRRA